MSLNCVKSDVVSYRCPRVSQKEVLNTVSLMMGPTVNVRVILKYAHNAHNRMKKGLMFSQIFQMQKLWK